MTRARLRVSSQDGGTLLGVLPTVAETLSFSVERGGAGSCDFEVVTSTLDSLGARDSLIRLELESAPATWTPVAAYTLRPPFKRPRILGPITTCTATAVLEQWSGETLILPEYSAGDIPRGAGTDRALGWPSTAYDPDGDPNEPWSGVYETSRTTMPSASAETGAAWPTGTGAKWISITGATDQAERKLFRSSSAAPLTIATAGPVRVHLASDSPGTFFVASEPLLSVQGGEPGREPIRFEQVDMWLEPGEYACAYDTSSIWDTGGDGVDPVIVAICSLDSDGDPDTWLLVSNDTDWVACRRDEDPPDNEPPGPTPGAMLTYLVAEAQDRDATGWAGVTLGFDADEDSYGDPWPATSTVIERQVRYGSDTLWSVFQMLAETEECDVWMGADLVLHCAPKQGETSAAALVLATGSDTQSEDAGTWVAALAIDGWITASQPGPRREFGMEVGTALSRAVAGRIVAAALAENGRWDGSVRLAPESAVPLLDFNVGDTVPLSYGSGTPGSVEVLSVSASVGESGHLLWDLELSQAGS